MTVVFSWLVATFITIPVLGYIVFFVISKQITKNHRKAVQASIDLSTILFICSVHYLIKAIWGLSLIWVIILTMLIMAIIVVLVHYKVKEEIVLDKIFKGFWRVNFLLFFCAYLLLVLYGMIVRVRDVF
ncbi:DUF3397 domain-containing protein [Peribacillus tepidiphilus]|uniref:DUF3397 domain-containing protein n=1 Tax=Peribacillus tepidiphilus TaxID=2652445 RepID=UPI001291874E|nr:DUF3397 domain-containing protein [Peribacillus tepidiphilus]